MNSPTELKLRQLIAEQQTRLAQGYVYSIELEGKTVWVKHRPDSKKRSWHTLQNIISKQLKLPIFACTVSTGGASSLLDESKRLKRMKDQGILVPEVVLVTAEFLATYDTGVPLHSYIQDLADDSLVQALLLKAVKAVSHLHHQLLCHGRPSSRDLMVYQQDIYFIDLEENPLASMSLAEAQARDAWLLFCNLSRYCHQSQLAQLVKYYLDYSRPEVRGALNQLVKPLKPLRIIAEYLFKPVAGRDLMGAIKATKALECELKHTA